MVVVGVDVVVSVVLEFDGCGAVTGKGSESVAGVAGTAGGALAAILALNDATAAAISRSLALRISNLSGSCAVHTSSTKRIPI